MAKETAQKGDCGKNAAQRPPRPFVLWETWKSIVLQLMNQASSLFCQRTKRTNCSLSFLCKNVMYTLQELVPHKLLPSFKWDIRDFWEWIPWILILLVSNLKSLYQKVLRIRSTFSQKIHISIFGHKFTYSAESWQFDYRLDISIQCWALKINC